MHPKSNPIPQELRAAVHFKARQILLQSIIDILVGLNELYHEPAMYHQRREILLAKRMQERRLQKVIDDIAASYERGRQ